MIHCIDEVKKQVRRDMGLSVIDVQVERVLAEKLCSMDEDARDIIQKQSRLYTERLLSAAMEAGFDLKAIPVVMLGGGAALSLTLSLSLVDECRTYSACASFSIRQSSGDGCAQPMAAFSIPSLQSRE